MTSRQFFTASAIAVSLLLLSAVLIDFTALKAIPAALGIVAVAIFVGSVAAVVTPPPSSDD